MEKRRYRQFCGLARSLDVVGERWTLLIVRNLLLGPQRYSELLRGLPGITTNLLAKRLAEMEEFGLLEKARSSASDAGSHYRLTALGAALEPAVQALAIWAWQWMAAPADDEQLSIEWLLASLRGRYRGGASLRAEVTVDGVSYRLVLRDDVAEILRGGLPDAELRVRGPLESALRLFVQPWHRGHPPAGLTVDGSDALLWELANSFR